MVTIYVQNKPLFLVENIDTKIQEHMGKPGTVFFEKYGPDNVSAVLQQMEKEEVKTGIFQHSIVAELLQSFTSHLTLIKAAGGLVHTPENLLLLIFRKGKWDLPKGKLEEGEDLASCAMREIEEETGLQGVKINKPLFTTYHTYYEGGKHILKESYWFLMTSEKAVPLNPQVEEDIEKCEWVSVSEISSYMPNMHASIIDVVNEGLKQIKAS